jgi:hypothetical protein
MDVPEVMGGVEFAGKSFVEGWSQAKRQNWNHERELRKVHCVVLCLCEGWCDLRYIKQYIYGDRDGVCTKTYEYV